MVAQFNTPCGSKLLFLFVALVLSVRSLPCYLITERWPYSDVGSVVVDQTRARRWPRFAATRYGGLAGSGRAQSCGDKSEAVKEVGVARVNARAIDGSGCGRAPFACWRVLPWLDDVIRGLLALHKSIELWIGHNCTARGYPTTTSSDRTKYETWIVRREEDPVCQPLEMVELQ